ncbi:MAG: ATP-binding cassette domain-containing protein [Actinomycetota bacterium]|nr:ATP-binding cassette domain-containing protein [Actinomycetota bacterium]MDA8208538.1 ATP-binding cassette domain-containing protein [Actinomycetota bacterium]
MRRSGREGAGGTRASALVMSAVAVGSAFLLLPLAALLVYFGGHRAGPPTTSDLWQATFNSIAASVISIVLVVLVGVPTGHWLHRHSTRRAHLLATLLRLPLGVPPMVAGVMLLVAFGPESPIGKALGGRLVNTLAAIVLAQAFASLPYVVEGSRGAFGGIDPRAGVVARSLGMGPVAEMIQVSIPLAWSSIRSSIILGYLRAFGEFGAVLLVAYSPFSLPVYTYVVFEGSGLGATAAPVVATLALSGLVALGISRLSWPSSRLLALLGRVAGSRPAPGTTPAASAAQGSRIRVEGTVGDFSLHADFTAYKGCTVLLGPSGSGKTLTLNALCGSVAPGLEVTAEGEVGAKRGEAIGYVPQRFGLFPHMTLEQNLRLAAIYGSEGGSPEALLTRMHLGEFAGRGPGSLSGGQYQRGALARAMAANSSLVVLDEPLSALDAQMRLEHLRFIETHVKSAVDFLFVVTHDVMEAAYLADRLLVMHGGRVLQEGEAAEVLRGPSSVEVARIIGADNVLLLADHSDVEADLRGRTACFFSADISALPAATAEVGQGRRRLGRAKVVEVRRMPWQSEALLDLAGAEVVARLWEPGGAVLKPGARVDLTVLAERLYLY